MSSEPRKAKESEEKGGCLRCAVLEVRLSEMEWQLREAQQAIELLKAMAKRNSSNSHQPPSSDPPSAPPRPGKPPTGRKPGGQPGHPPHLRKLLPPERVNRYEHHYPQVCEHCQKKLPGNPSKDDPQPLRHQVFELPELAGMVIEHQAHARYCPCCGKLNWAELPVEAVAHPFGPRLCALASYLVGRCHDGRRTVQEIFADVFGLPISTGAISHREQEMSRALEPSWVQARKAVRQAPVKHADETGWQLAGDNCWLWLGAGQKAACFLVHARRNSQAFFELLGKKVKGFLVSDRHGTYNRVPLDHRGVCWAHLKRDFKKWAEFGKKTQRLGEDGLAITQKIFGCWRDFKQGRIDRVTLQQQIEPVRQRMRQVLNWHLRCRHRPAAEFCRRLMKLEPALWLFAFAQGVEPTNNHAERLLRQAVLWRKNSFGSNSERGCRFAERMLTAIQTLRMRERSVLRYLQEALTAYRQGLPCPSLF
jgi:transposase